MTIQIDKNGFGIASLFSKSSTKERLMEMPTMKGSYLDELGIKYKVGDKIILCSNAKYGGQFVWQIKVYAIEGDKYLCEFLQPNEKKSMAELSKI